MAIPEDRMSTSVVINDWLPPDERYRTLDVDYEAGPIALNDPTAGLAYQPWELTWDLGTGNFTVTPETTGSPSVVLNSGGANVTQLSLAFDQNGHVNVAYTANTGTFLYWYDSLISNWVTTQLPAAVFMPTLTLDDKRITQTNASDIMLWWTEEQPDGTYNLYRAYQRDRFNPLVPKEMATDINPYIYKLGMHKGFRLQLGLSDRVL
jgi:hypothetical protein